MDALNTLTAKPLLDYLLAVAGMESPILTIDPAWAVFRRYLLIPDRDGKALASYQAAVTTDEDGSPTSLLVRFAREVTDDAPGFRLSRSVFLQFIIEGDCSGLEDEERWTSDFTDLDAFYSTVNGLASFHFALSHPCSSGECMLDEMAADEGVA